MATKPTDIDAMRAIVDEHHAGLEDELGVLLKAVKKRLLTKHRDHYDPIVAQLDRRLAECLSQNEAEARRGLDLVAQLRRTDRILANLVDHIIRYRNKDRTFNLHARIFSAWADLVCDRSLLLRLATRRFLDRPEVRALFRRWVRRWRKVSVQRQKRELRRASERDLRAQESEASQRIAAMQAELDAVRRLLVDHEQQHAEMQEKLRRAFMRGVVNLNLEAMDVFGEIPTAETVPPQKADRRAARRRDAHDGADDFLVEPAPRISVVRHR
jgi:hypothetical protein